MVKIINGKKYSTETAKSLGSWDAQYGAGDFKYEYEELYKKENNEYFLYGEGGPRTKYAESCGDGWQSGESIIPMTEEEAKEWAEEHLTGEEYIEIFGDVEE